jgi:Raf kinase inhibitor-like YbhB/YbcL family protein
VTFYDQDAPTGSGFWHWIVTDIPASVTSISPTTIPAGAVSGINDAGVTDFIGPCPPVGRTHTYQYTVHALDTDALGAPTGASGALTGFFLYQHTLEKATLDIIAGPRQ